MLNFCPGIGGNSWRIPIIFLYHANASFTEISLTLPWQQASSLLLWAICNSLVPISLKYSRYIKDKIKIKFVQEFDLDKKYKDITDLIEYLYDNNENIYYIKFDIKSFQYYILKALNDLQEVPDEVKNYYYDKLHKDVIFSKDKFINYLAGQSPEYYYVETFIAYILSPDKLKQLDKKMFDYWVNEIERR